LRIQKDLWHFSTSPFLKSRSSIHSKTKGEARKLTSTNISKAPLPNRALIQGQETPALRTDLRVYKM